MNARTSKGMALLSIPLIPLAVGCVRVPSGDVAAAEAAMAAAVAEEAPEYAPEAWIAAQNAQSELEVELLAQKEASLITRSYRHAKTQATAVRVAAERAVAEAQERKSVAREDAARAIEGAKVRYQEMSTRVGDGSTIAGLSGKAAAASAEVSSCETLLQQADHALVEGRYTLAREKAEEALQSLDRALERAPESRPVGGGTSAAHRAPGAVVAQPASRRPVDSTVPREDPA